jgi:O-antigen/teichoic acid export membrane protein
MEPSASPRRSALASGFLTAASLAVVTGLSAVVGVVIAREFGRGAETDGFFAAYAVFLVLVLVGTAMRVAVIPPLARAREAGTFARELGSYAAALAVIAVPALLLALLASDWAAGQLAAGLPESAQAVAADTLRFVVPAAIAQMYAALFASGLAAFDSYGTAAAGYAAGSLAGLALILLLVDSRGIDAVAWGMLLNGVVALAVPLVALGRRAPWAGLGSIGLGAHAVWPRLAELARAVAVPLVLQGLFVVCVRFVSELGTGAVTSFTYAYLVAAGLVAVTASSLGLVSSAALSRRELTDRRAAEHVVRSSWLAFAAVAAAAGVFALVGDRFVGAVLGPDYAGQTGNELGRLIALLGPWMAASIGVTLTFPLIFVAARARLLPAVAVGALVLHLVLAWAAVRAWELDGAALALTVSTLAILVALLALLSRDVLAAAGRGLGLAAVATGGLAALAFGALDLVAGAALAAARGLAAFAVLLVGTSSLGLRQAWAYLRALE